MTTTWLIIAIVYILGALVTWLLVRKWENVLLDKIAAVAVWPGTLILYIIHLLHKEL